MPTKGIGARARAVNLKTERWPLLGLAHYWQMTGEGNYQQDEVARATLVGVGNYSPTDDRQGFRFAPILGSIPPMRFTTQPTNYPLIAGKPWTINAWYRNFGSITDNTLFGWSSDGQPETTNLRIILDPGFNFCYVHGADEGALTLDFPAATSGFWRMVTIVQDPAAPSISLYSNGRLSHTINSASPVGSQILPINLGAGWVTAPFGNYAIQDLSVHTKALTQQDIFWLYDGGLGRRYPHY